MNWIKTSILALSFFTLTAYAGLSIKTDFENSKVLPQKIRNVQFRYLSIGLTDLFDNSGSSVSLSSKLSKVITWQDVVDSKDLAVEREKVLSGIQADGQSLSDSPGSTSAFIKGSVSVIAPVIAYGVSKDLTIAVAVPIFRNQLNVDTSFLKNQGGQSLVDRLNNSGNAPAARLAANALVDPIQKKLKENGYKRLESFDEQEVGDIKIVGKYSLGKTGLISHGLKGTLTTPTGRPADPDRLVDLPTGDGQWDIDITYIIESPLSDEGIGRKFTAMAYSGYTAQLPDRLEARIPEEHGEKITPDKDPNTLRDLGDIIHGGVGLSFEAFSGFSLSGGYNIQYKGEDTYTGDVYSSERYGWMSDETQQMLQNAVAGISYSTIPAFKAKKFALPGVASLRLALPIAGKNIAETKAVTFETSLFF